MVKPFSPRELTARIKAVLRRAGKNAPDAEIIREGGIVLNRISRYVTAGERRVDLTPSEFDLLAAMMSSPGRVYSRLDLLEHLHGMAFEGYERTIDVHIKNLRAKIEPDIKSPTYIETVYGIGYRFSLEDKNKA